MNLLLDATREIKGDKKRIRTLASIGTICLMLFALTFCFSAVIIYNLYEKNRLLEYENKALKEIIWQSEPLEKQVTLLTP